MPEEIKQAKIVELDVETLEENENNPRVMEPKAYRALVASLETFGNVGVLVYNERSKRVVGGNQKLKILKARGVKTTPAMVVDLSDEDENALLIELNNQMSMGKWEPESAVKKLEEFRASRPELYDQLNFGNLRREIMGAAEKRPESQFDSIPDMEIQPYEHWDYIVLVFKDSRDWLSALGYLGIGKVKRNILGAKNIKTGLGRCVDGKRFLEKVGIGPKAGE
jgi:hypothetical protein